MGTEENKQIIFGIVVITIAQVIATLLNFENIGVITMLAVIAQIINTKSGLRG